MAQKRKQAFASPIIIQEVRLDISAPLLAGSVLTNKSNIETAAQKVDDHSFSDSLFDSKWE